MSKNICVDIFCGFSWIKHGHKDLVGWLFFIWEVKIPPQFWLSETLERFSVSDTDLC